MNLSRVIFWILTLLLLGIDFVLESLSPFAPLSAPISVTSFFYRERHAHFYSKTSLLLEVYDNNEQQIYQFVYQFASEDVTAQLIKGRRATRAKRARRRSPICPTRVLPWQRWPYWSVINEREREVARWSWWADDDRPDLTKIRWIRMEDTKR